MHTVVEEYRKHRAWSLEDRAKRNEAKRKRRAARAAEWRQAVEQAVNGYLDAHRKEYPAS